MIPTLVVDDDYRVAGIHAASVERVPGFHCVGEAHTAAEARHAPPIGVLDATLSPHRGHWRVDRARQEHGTDEDDG